MTGLPPVMAAAAKGDNAVGGETSLSTALYLAYTASAISLFGIVVGVALLLSGIGFLILALSGAIEHVPFRRSSGAKPATQSE